MRLNTKDLAVVLLATSLALMGGAIIHLARRVETLEEQRSPYYFPASPPVPREPEHKMCRHRENPR